MLVCPHGSPAPPAPVPATASAAFVFNVVVFGATSSECAIERVSGQVEGAEGRGRLGLTIRSAREAAAIAEGNGESGGKPAVCCGYGLPGQIRPRSPAKLDTHRVNAREIVSSDSCVDPRGVGK